MSLWKYDDIFLTLSSMLPVTNRHAPKYKIHTLLLYIYVPLPGCSFTMPVAFLFSPFGTTTTSGANTLRSYDSDLHLSEESVPNEWNLGKDAQRCTLMVLSSNRYPTIKSGSRMLWLFRFQYQSSIRFVNHQTRSVLIPVGAYRPAPFNFLYWTPQHTFFLFCCRIVGKLKQMWLFSWKSLNFEALVKANIGPYSLGKRIYPSSWNYVTKQTIENMYDMTHQQLSQIWCLHSSSSGFDDVFFRVMCILIQSTATWNCSH